MGITDTLKSVGDVERLAGKISNGNFNPKNCIALRNALNTLPAIKMQLLGFTSPILTDIREGIPEMNEIAELLENAIADEPPAMMKDGGYIKKGFNEELDKLRNMNVDAKSVIVEIEQRERERTGIKNLKVGYNRVFGYYIEISNSFKDKAPADYIRKQTLTTGERYITEELKLLEEKVLSSGEKALALEDRIYKWLMGILTEKIDEFQKISASLSLLDCLTSFATVAKERSTSSSASTAAVFWMRGDAAATCSRSSLKSANSNAQSLSEAPSTVASISLSSSVI
jgi:DNA mismatch repair protein MutS